MKKLYNYIFHFSDSTGLWAAIPRDKYNEYWNDYENRVKVGVLYAKDVPTLIDFITKSKKNV